MSGDCAQPFEACEFSDDFRIINFAEQLVPAGRLEPQGVTLYTQWVAKWVQADTLDEAIGIVNGNEHGNGTALFTRSGPAARKFQNEVEVGLLHHETDEFVQVLGICIRRL